MFCDFYGTHCTFLASSLLVFLVGQAMGRSLCVLTCRVIILVIILTCAFAFFLIVFVCVDRLTISYE